MASDRLGVLSRQLAPPPACPTKVCLFFFLLVVSAIES